MSDSCYPSNVNPYKHKVAVGNPTYVCVNIGPVDWVAESSGSYLNFPRTVKADELSSVQISQCTSANGVFVNCHICKPCSSVDLVGVPK
jgi:hypothetical protein